MKEPSIQDSDPSVGTNLFPPSALPNSDALEDVLVEVVGLSPNATGTCQIFLLVAAEPTSMMASPADVFSPDSVSFVPKQTLLSAARVLLELGGPAGRVRVRVSHQVHLELLNVVVRKQESFSSDDSPVELLSG